MANNPERNRRGHETLGLSLILVLLMVSVGVAHAQDTNPCIEYLGRDCDSPHRPAPPVFNELWNAIAYSPSRNVAAYAGSYTAPENAKAAAMKGCAARASDCRIVVAAHDICVAVAYERSAGGRYLTAVGATQQDAQGKALPVCVAQGPKHCAVVARCTGTPPIVFVTQ
jgi:hypothetical protein